MQERPRASGVAGWARMLRKVAAPRIILAAATRKLKPRSAADPKVTLSSPGPSPSRAALAARPPNREPGHIAVVMQMADGRQQRRRRRHGHARRWDVAVPLQRATASSRGKPLMSCHDSRRAAAWLVARETPREQPSVMLSRLCMAARAEDCPASSMLVALLKVRRRIPLADNELGQSKQAGPTACCGFRSLKKRL
eukprot:310496-Chlamydomonas_euryale.AAC.5